jgi:sulfate transport system ATP-binding protein
VTHDQEEAFELADRVVVMGDGQIEQIGHPDQIHDHPATPFVARFMGATVEIPVILNAGRAEAPGVDTSRLSRRALPDGPANLFVRPDDLTPVRDLVGPWKVTSITSTGAQLRLVLSNPLGRDVPVEMQRRAPEARDLSVGATVHLRPEAGTVFPEPRGRSAPAFAPIPVGDRPSLNPKENLR